MNDRNTLLKRRLRISPGAPSGRRSVPGAPLAALAGAVATLALTVTTLPAAAQSDRGRLLVPDYRPSFGKLRDTLFLLDTTYLEVRLDQQAIYQHFRSGKVERYLCSTGNPTIKDGIATRPGIYTIQWKAKKYLSQQFDVYLNYWMPFDGGIGFHGLQGRSYYRFLGRRASSHGCVRISNETGSRLFSTSGRGTLVFVHSGTPARVVAFADSSLPGLQIVNELDAGLLARRLDAVTSGRLDDSTLIQRLGLAARTHFAGRVGVGSISPAFVAQGELPLLDPWRLPRPIPERILPAAPLPSLTTTDGAEGEPIRKVDS